MCSHEAVALNYAKNEGFAKRSPTFERQLSTRTWGRVDNGKVERRFAATEVSTGREGREINKEYCSLYAWLILCHAAVQNMQPNRPHQIPIHSIYVLTSTPAY
jgi:hypothetical protein